GILVIANANVCADERKPATFDGKTITEWTESLQNGSRAEKRLAIETLGRFGSLASDAIPKLIPPLRSDDAEINQSAVAALTRIGRSAVPEVTKLLTDQNTLVVARAIAVLKAIDPNSNPASHAFRQFADPNLRRNLESQRRMANSFEKVGITELLGAYEQ